MLSDNAQLLLISLLASIVLTGIYRQLALRYAWLAHVDHRSAHHRATPRSAGIIIIFLAVVYISYQVAAGAISGWQCLWLLLPALIGLVGLIDDAWSLSAGLRLLFYGLLVGAMVLAFAPLAPLDLGVFTVQAAVVLVPLYVLVICWWVNLFNFMDGINGIAGSQFLFVVLAALALQPLNSSPQLELVLVISAATVGFLCWNLPRGRVFLGDAGSTFLAASLAWFALHRIEQGSFSPLLWLILAACFITDASYTLAVRILSDQSWTRPHASHGYQILARRWRSHSQVVFAVGLVNLLWLLPLAWLANSYPEYVLALTAVAYAPLVVIVARLGAGRSDY